MYPSDSPPVDLINYDLSLDILKTPEQIEAERLAKEQEARQRAAELAAKNTNRDEEKDISKTVRPINAANIPIIDRSQKPKTSNVSNHQVPSQAPSANPIRVTNNLKDLRQIMDEDSGKPPKNTNVTAQQATEGVKIMPSVPARNLKPSGSASSISSGNSSVPSDVERERSETEALLAKKKQTLEELERLEILKQQETKGMANLMRARRKLEEESKVKAEEEALLAKKKQIMEEIEKLENLKQQEAKGMANLMRARKKLEEESKVKDEEEAKRSVSFSAHLKCVNICVSFPSEIALLIFQMARWGRKDASEEAGRETTAY